MREMLKEIATKTREKTDDAVLQAEDWMDDGTPIRLKIEISDDVRGHVMVM